MTKTHRLRGCLLAVGFFVIAGQQLHGQSVPETGKESMIAELNFELSSIESRRDAVASEIERATVELKRLEIRRREAFARQDAIGISAESFGEVMTTLQAQRVELSIDLAGIDARREAITLEVERQAAVQSSASSALIQKLTELVDMQKEMLAQRERLSESGAVSARELAESRRSLLEAEIRLLQVSAPASTGSALNDQLLQASLERAEKRARLQKIEEMLSQYTGARDEIDRVELVDRQRDKTENLIAVFTSELAEIEFTIQSTKQKIRDLEDLDRDF